MDAMTRLSRLSKKAAPLLLRTSSVVAVATICWSLVSCADRGRQQASRSQGAPQPSCDTALRIVVAPDARLSAVEACTLATRARGIWFDSALVKFGIDTSTLGAVESVMVGGLELRPGAPGGRDTLDAQLGGGVEGSFWALTFRLPRHALDALVLIDKGNRGAIARLALK